jgi:protein gp37
MPGDSAIEWTERTWNPVTGCSKVSPGCAHCYAETFAERWRGIPGHPYEQGFDLKLWPARLDIPGRWRKPSVIFVNSMSDLFHEDIPEAYIERVFVRMMLAGQHTFQVLTKRPERMADVVPRIYESLSRQSPDRVGPLPNVWLGVSIENRRFVGRADLLRRVPAAVRFISAEPLLGPLRHTDVYEDGCTSYADGYADAELDLTGIDWLICGGESGPKARPMDLAWARDLRDACATTGVPFFLKQLGGRGSRKRGGDLAVLDGARHTEMPALAAATAR